MAYKTSKTFLIMFLLIFISSGIGWTRIVLCLEGGITSSFSVWNFNYGTSPINLKAGANLAFNPAIGITTGFDYQFGFKNNECFPTDDYKKGYFKVQLVSIDGGLYFNLFRGLRIIPYINGGFKYTFFGFKNLSGSVPSEFKNLKKPCFYFGGGFRYGLTDKLLLNLPVNINMYLAGDDGKSQLGGKISFILSIGAILEYYFI
ncbi:MAG: hypothetical protein ACUVWP_03925 [bacterium]